jgi:hypothetical protein
MNERDSIYLQLLGHGLIRLRDAASAGNADYCTVEADHLHNLPSLIGEPNQQRHDYYLDQERSLYLNRVDRSVLGISFNLDRYSELWQRLFELRGAEQGNAADSR